MIGDLQQFSNEYLQIWSWEYFDTGGMLMQLGMMPMDTGDGEGV